MESGRTKSVINYDPDLLYNVLLGHKNGNLDKIYTINFPEKFGTPEFPLVVEIISRIPYTNENNVAKLYLKSNPIREAERYGNKFLRMNELGKKEQDVRIQYLEELIRKMDVQIQILTAKTNKTNKTNKNQTPEERTSKIAELDTTLYNDIVLQNVLKDQLKLDDYVTRKELKDFDYVTDDELGEVLNMYVTKANQKIQDARIENTYVTKTELAIFATNIGTTYPFTKV